jgi:imidazolonepropionase-like amidohydrolase
MYKLVKTKAIIDGNNPNPLYNGCILIKDGLIERVGHIDDFGALVNHAEVVDLSECYILPGLIDSHTHLSIVPSLGNQLDQMKLPGSKNILRSMPNINKSLASGVTTMRIMGEEHFIDIEIKEAINKKLIQGPRLLVSGRGIVASNGHGAAITVSDGEDEIRKHSRENLAMGADLLKAFVTGGVSSSGKGLDYCSYSRKELAVIVEEAERVGKYVAAHAHGGKGVDLCIEEGVRTIEHGALLTESQIDRIIKNDMWIIGTFSILFHPTGIEYTDFKVPEIKEKVLRTREVVESTFHHVIHSNAKLALGTDSMHGLISYEMECLVKFGANSFQAIQAVTKHAAQACQIEDKAGTLESGKWADFIGVKQNPLENVKHLNHVQVVYKEGEEVAKRSPTA